MSKMRANPAGTGARTSRTPEFCSSSLEMQVDETHARRIAGGFIELWLGGGAYRDRTDDPLLAKQVLSHLS